MGSTVNSPKLQLLQPRFDTIVCVELAHSSCVLMSVPFPPSALIYFTLPGHACLEPKVKGVWLSFALKEH